MLSGVRPGFQNSWASRQAGRSAVQDAASVVSSYAQQSGGISREWNGDRSQSGVRGSIRSPPTVVVQGAKHGNAADTVAGLGGGKPGAYDGTPCGNKRSDNHNIIYATFLQAKRNARRRLCGSRVRGRWRSSRCGSPFRSPGPQWFRGSWGGRRRRSPCGPRTTAGRHRPWGRSRPAGFHMAMATLPSR